MGVIAVFLFGLVIVLSGAAQSGTENASLGAGLEGPFARHSTLPFGTRLKVVNPETGREAEVIVAGRLSEDALLPLEISESAAEELGVSPEAATTELHYQVQTFEDSGVSSSVAAPSVSSPPADSPVSAPPAAPVNPAAPSVSSPPVDSSVSAPPAAPVNPAAPSVSSPPVDSPVSTPPAAPKAPAISVPLVVLPSARIIPCAPGPESTRIYRVQAGSYKSAANARAAFDRLNNAGFRAFYERFGDNYRVVISGVPASGIQMVACRLGAAGFPEIWIRPEN